jgi:hypothetical protein
MFGLEGGSGSKKKKKDNFVFDLEKDMKNPALFRKTKDSLETKIHKIKAALRSGENKDAFDTLGVLLHGYSSAMKVVSRASKAK